MPIQPQRNVMAQFQARPADIQFSQFGVPRPSMQGLDTTGGLPSLTPPQLSPDELGNFFGGGGSGGGGFGGNAGGGFLPPFFNLGPSSTLPGFNAVTFGSPLGLQSAMETIAYRPRQVFTG